MKFFWCYKATSFFRHNFNVYIDVDNRERARAGEIKNKVNQFRWKNNIKIFDKIRNGSSHQGGIKLTTALKKKKKKERKT